MRRRARTDRNHKAIRDALRLTGWFIHDCSRVGGGFPDLVAARAGRLELLEIKDGRKPPSARLLTDDETKVHRAFAAAGIEVRVLLSVDEALAL